MALKIVYYNIIIPITNLSKCKDINSLAGILDFYTKPGKLKSVWHDDHLFTIGGIMNPGDVEKEVRVLEDLGLNLHPKVNGEQSWDDLCVVSFVDGPTLPCSWLECHINPYDTSYVWLKGQEVGTLIKPRLIEEAKTGNKLLNFLNLISKLWRK